MKKLLLFCFTSFGLLSSCERLLKPELLDGTWLQVNESVYCKMEFQAHPQGFQKVLCLIKDSSLSSLNHHYELMEDSLINGSGVPIIIRKLTEDSLFLMIDDCISEGYVRLRNDTSVHVEKIIFSSHNGYGSTKEGSFEIDSSGTLYRNIYVDSSYVRGDTHGVTYNFIKTQTQLPVGYFDYFRDLIQKSGFNKRKRVEEFEQQPIDGGHYVVKIYYNDTSFVYSTQGLHKVNEVLERAYFDMLLLEQSAKYEPSTHKIEELPGRVRLPTIEYTKTK